MSLLSHFYIYSIIYVSMNSWIFYCIQWVKIQYCLCFLFLNSSFGHWRLLYHHPCDFFLKHLFSGTPRCCELHLCISCPSPRISHFSQKLQFLLLEKIELPTKIWGLIWLFLLGCHYVCPLSLQRKEIHVYANSCIYSYLSVFLYAAPLLIELKLTDVSASNALPHGSF